jgi:hypothetical protein
VPAPTGTEIPLTYVLLDSTTTTLDWNTFHNSLGDARLHVTPPMLNVLDRLRQLEGYSGNEPSLATTGAGASSVDEVNHRLDGLTNVRLTNLTNSQALVWSQASGLWVNGTVTGSSGGGGTVTDISTQTPAGVGASPTAGTSASAAAGDHVHRGILAVLAGNGASVSTDSAGCATISLSPISWASAIQTPNRALDVVYTNSTLTRMVTISVGMKPTLTVSNELSFRADAASPPTTEVAKLAATSGLGASVVSTLTALIMPSEKYWLKNLTGTGPTTEIVRWIEYDDSAAGGGAAALMDANWLARADGRLTLAPGSPVDITGIGSAASLYYSPYIGNQIGLITASAASVVSFSEISLDLNALSPNSNYDVFGFLNGGTLALESNRWANDTTRNAGLNRVNGTLVRSLDNTRRYLGTVRISGNSGWTADNTSQRFVWNNYNRVSRSLSVIDTTDSWNYAVTAWRAANGNNANRVEYVAGVSDDMVVACVLAQAGIGVGIAGAVGVGVDTTTANAAGLVQEFVGSQTTTNAQSQYLGYPGLGYHYLQWVEYRRAGTVLFIGDDGVADQQSGLFGIVSA